MKPESYREQNGCWNCWHIYTMLERDAKAQNGIISVYNIHTKLCNGCETVSHGICDEWKKREGEK